MKVGSEALRWLRSGIVNQKKKKRKKNDDRRHGDIKNEEKNEPYSLGRSVRVVFEKRRAKNLNTRKNINFLLSYLRATFGEHNGRCLNRKTKNTREHVRLGRYYFTPCLALSRTLR